MIHIDIDEISDTWECLAPTVSKLAPSKMFRV